jgi:hypothetical protein
MTKAPPTIEIITERAYNKALVEIAYEQMLAKNVVEMVETIGLIDFVYWGKDFLEDLQDPAFGSKANLIAKVANQYLPVNNFRISQFKTRPDYGITN